MGLPNDEQRLECYKSLHKSIEAKAGASIPKSFDWQQLVGDLGSANDALAIEAARFASRVYEHDLDKQEALTDEFTLSLVEGAAGNLALPGIQRFRLQGIIHLLSNVAKWATDALALRMISSLLPCLSQTNDWQSSTMLPRLALQLLDRLSISCPGPVLETLADWAPRVWCLMVAVPDSQVPQVQEKCGLLRSNATILVSRMLGQLLGEADPTAPHAARPPAGLFATQSQLQSQSQQQAGGASQGAGGGRLSRTGLTHTLQQQLMHALRREGDLLRCMQRLMAPLEQCISRAGEGKGGRQTLMWHEREGVVACLKAWGVYVHFLGKYLINPLPFQRQQQQQQQQGLGGAPPTNCHPPGQEMLKIVNPAFKASGQEACVAEAALAAWQQCFDCFRGAGKQRCNVALMIKPILYTLSSDRRPEVRRAAVSCWSALVGALLCPLSFRSEPTTSSATAVANNAAQAAQQAAERVLAAAQAAAASVRGLNMAPAPPASDGAGAAADGAGVGAGAGGGPSSSGRGQQVRSASASPLHGGGQRASPHSTTPAPAALWLSAAASGELAADGSGGYVTPAGACAYGGGSLPVAAVAALSPFLLHSNLYTPVPGSVEAMRHRAAAASAAAAASGTPGKKLKRNKLVPSQQQQQQSQQQDGAVAPGSRTSSAGAIASDPYGAHAWFTLSPYEWKEGVAALLERTLLRLSAPQDAAQLHHEQAQLSAILTVLMNAASPALAPHICDALEEVIYPPQAEGTSARQRRGSAGDEWIALAHPQLYALLARLFVALLLQPCLSGGPSAAPVGSTSGPAGRATGAPAAAGASSAAGGGGAAAAAAAAAAVEQFSAADAWEAWRSCMTQLLERTRRLFMDRSAGQGQGQGQKQGHAPWALTAETAMAYTQDVTVCLATCCHAAAACHPGSQQPAAWGALQPALEAAVKAIPFRWLAASTDGPASALVIAAAAPAHSPAPAAVGALAKRKTAGGVPPLSPGPAAGAGAGAGSGFVYAKGCEPCAFVHLVRAWLAQTCTGAGTAAGSGSVELRGPASQHTHPAPPAGSAGRFAAEGYERVMALALDARCDYAGPSTAQKLSALRNLCIAVRAVAPLHVQVGPCCLAQGRAPARVQGGAGQAAASAAAAAAADRSMLHAAVSRQVALLAFVLKFAAARLPTWLEGPMQGEVQRCCLALLLLPLELLDNTAVQLRALATGKGSSSGSHSGRALLDSWVLPDAGQARALGVACAQLHAQVRERSAGAMEDSTTRHVVQKIARALMRCVQPAHAGDVQEGDAAEEDSEEGWHLLRDDPAWLLLGPAVEGTVSHLIALSLTPLPNVTKRKGSSATAAAAAAGAGSLTPRGGTAAAGLTPGLNVGSTPATGLTPSHSITARMLGTCSTPGGTAAGGAGAGAGAGQTSPSECYNLAVTLCAAHLDAACNSHGVSCPLGAAGHDTSCRPPAGIAHAAAHGLRALALLLLSAPEPATVGSESHARAGPFSTPDHVLWLCRQEVTHCMHNVEKELQQCVRLQQQQQGRGQHGQGQQQQQQQQHQADVTITLPPSFAEGSRAALDALISGWDALLSALCRLYAQKRFHPQHEGAICNEPMLLDLSGAIASLLASKDEHVRMLTYNRVQQLMPLGGIDDEDLLPNTIYMALHNMSNAMGVAASQPTASQLQLAAGAAAPAPAACAGGIRPAIPTLNLSAVARTVATPAPATAAAAAAAAAPVPILGSKRAGDMGAPSTSAPAKQHQNQHQQRKSFAFGQASQTEYVRIAPEPSRLMLPPSKRARLATGLNTGIPMLDGSQPQGGLGLGAGSHDSQSELLPGNDEHEQVPHDDGDDGGANGDGYRCGVGGGDVEMGGDGDGGTSANDAGAGASTGNGIADGGGGSKAGAGAGAGAVSMEVDGGDLQGQVGSAAAADAADAPAPAPVAACSLLQQGLGHGSGASEQGYIATLALHGTASLQQATAADAAAAMGAASCAAADAAAPGAGEAAPGAAAAAAAMGAGGPMESDGGAGAAADAAQGAAAPAPDAATGAGLASVHDAVATEVICIDVDDDDDDDEVIPSSLQLPPPAGASPHGPAAAAGDASCLLGQQGVVVMGSLGSLGLLAAPVGLPLLCAERAASVAVAGAGAGAGAKQEVLEALLPLGAVHAHPATSAPAGDEREEGTVVTGADGTGDVLMDVDVDAAAYDAAAACAEAVPAAAAADVPAQQGEGGAGLTSTAVAAAERGAAQAEGAAPAAGAIGGPEHGRGVSGACAAGEAEPQREDADDMGVNALELEASQVQVPRTAARGPMARPAASAAWPSGPAAQPQAAQCDAGLPLAPLVPGPNAGPSAAPTGREAHASDPAAAAAAAASAAPPHAASPLPSPAGAGGTGAGAGAPVARRQQVVSGMLPPAGGSRFKVPYAAASGGCTPPPTAAAAAKAPTGTPPPALGSSVAVSAGPPGAVQGRAATPEPRDALGDAGVGASAGAGATFQPLMVLEHLEAQGAALWEGTTPTDLVRMQACLMRLHASASSALLARLGAAPKPN